tara:strand:- start:5448 stop:5720 length:273 start_codon:yes stop_codon:yes gene_type:complete
MTFPPTPLDRSLKNAKKELERILLNMKAAMLQGSQRTDAAEIFSAGELTARLMRQARAQKHAVANLHNSRSIVAQAMLKAEAGQTEEAEV